LDLRRGKSRAALGHKLQDFSIVLSKSDARFLINGGFARGKKALFNFQTLCL
jgi:hypothetical protein